MKVRVITAATPVVTLDEAKQHLRVEADDDDSNGYIEGLVSAAQIWLDGPDGWLGRSIGVQQLEASGLAAGKCSQLRYGPVIEIVSVSFEDDDGQRIDADPETYHLDGGFLSVAPDADWSKRPGRRVTYWAGYGSRGQEGENDPEWVVEAPAPIKHAILLLVGQWFAVREAVNVGNIVNEMPFAVAALLQPYRVFRC